MAKLTVEDIMAREEAKERASSIRKLATQLTGGQYDNAWEKVFETVGCTCHPDRGRIEVLEKELKEELTITWHNQLLHEVTTRSGPIWEELSSKVPNTFNSWIGLEAPVRFMRKIEEEHPKRKEIDRIKKLVAETDAREHPLLDKAARESRPFVSMWLFQHPEMLGKPMKEVREAYATAWVHEGWRPT